MLDMKTRELVMEVHAWVIAFSATVDIYFYFFCAYLQSSATSVVLASNIQICLLIQLSFSRSPSARSSSGGCRGRCGGGLVAVAAAFKLEVWHLRSHSAVCLIG